MILGKLQLCASIALMLAIRSKCVAPLECWASPSIEWKKTTPFPEERAGCAVGAIHDRLILAGGTYWEGTKGHWTKKVFSASTHAFNPIGETWEKLPDLPVPLGYAASTVIDDKLFVLGGYTGTEVNRRIFTLEKRSSGYSWSTFGELPQGRLFARAVSVDKSIYLLGGTTEFEPLDTNGACCTSKSAVNTLLVLNTADPAKVWKQLRPFPGGKRFLFAVDTDGESVWMFGGIHQEKKTDPTTKFREVLQYNLVETNWKVMAPLPEDTLSTDPLTSLIISNKIILVSFARRVWQLDLGTLEYSELNPFPEEVFVDKFVWLGNRIIGAGGENKIEGPRRRSDWTFIGKYVLK
jgi:N-acetylneuraminic acid mutarotase